ncbi:MAG: GreA/GreB family elongation factor [Pseudarcicella sp.]|nr:GreA/GreB family elongation factor [Pseudarcicella sp.]MBP6410098.1 GreA/GreB family elongation factor [Pseudarcicella sp.]
MQLSHLSKVILFDLILNSVQERIDTAKFLMDEIQEAANNETKSSAGDKYETSRAMGQISKDMYTRQFYSANSEKEVLQKINLNLKFDFAFSGALVTTDIGVFFISISAGKIIHDHFTVIAVSPQSPIGAALYGKKAGDEFVFNSKTVVIKSIC